MNREDLEKQALETVSSDLYYDLADNIDAIDDELIYKLIACNGDFEKEMELTA